MLLVCPVSVLGNWRRELHRFSPALRVVLHHGKGRARTDEEFDQRAAEQRQSCLTSYNLLQRDEAILTTRAFEGVILDEAQNIKNPRRGSRARRAPCAATSSWR
jgi:SNF2 family DNA or RNA helicase